MSAGIRKCRVTLLTITDNEQALRMSPAIATILNRNDN